MLESLQIDRINAEMQPEVLQQLPITLLETVDSTNAWCIQRCKQGDKPPFVCLAEHQTQGRGRRGRHWQSPQSANIYLSLVWHFNMPIHQLACLPLVIGAAIITALGKVGLDAARLKWPNDVLVNNKKLAGVLIEAIPNEASHGQTMIIGVGVNVAMPNDVMPEAIEWVDVNSCVGGSINRSELVGKLLQCFVEACMRFETHTAQTIAWLQHYFQQNQRINVVTETGEAISGVMLGITERGELRVDVDGEERTYNSADISLRTPQEELC